MFSKSAFFAALFVFLGFTLRFAAAEAPPACVLMCLNQNEKVYDFNMVCKTNVSQMTSCLSKACKKEVYQEALDHYKETCKTAGINVAVPTGNPTESGSPSATATTSSSLPSGTGSNNNVTNSDDDEGASSKLNVNSMLALVAAFFAAIAL